MARHERAMKAVYRIVILASVLLGVAATAAVIYTAIVVGVALGGLLARAL